jgi:hypothetical protein
MCIGDDKQCPDYEEHKRKFTETLDLERRSFMKSAFAAAGGAAALGAGGLSLVTPAMAQAASKHQPAKAAIITCPANADTVHWGYFSKKLKPQVEIDSGDFVTMETLTHHANDDPDRMVKGDPGAESVYLWTKEKKGVDRRGAGPMDASDSRTRRGRRLRRAYLHGPDFRARSRTRRRARSAHHRRCAAAVGQPRNFPARPSAATRRRGGGFTTRT